MFITVTVMMAIVTTTTTMMIIIAVIIISINKTLVYKRIAPLQCIVLKSL